MKEITITLVVNDDDEQTKRDLLATIGARDNVEGSGRISPWIPGSVFTDVVSAKVDGETVFDRGQS